MKNKQQLHSYIFFLVLCCVIAFPADAQDYPVKWGPVNSKEGSIFATFRLIGFVDDQYIVQTPKAKTDILVGFDLNHKELFNIDIAESIGKKELDFRDIVRTANRSTAIFYDDDKDDNNWKLFAASFTNGKFGAIEQKFSKTYAKEIGHYSSLGGSAANTAFGPSRGSYDLPEKAISHDASKVAMLSRLAPSAKDKNFEIAVVVLDADMNPLWDRTYRLDVPANRIAIREFAVATNGDVFLCLAEEAEEKKGGKKSYLNTSHSLVRIRQEEQARLPLRFLSERFPDDYCLYLSPLDPNDYTIAGLYATEEERKRLEGIFLVNGNESTSSLSVVLHPFQDSLLRKLNTEKEIKKDEGLSGSFALDELVTFEDGSFALIAERRFITTQTMMTARGTTRTTTTYHSNEILVPTFSKSGQLVTIPIVDKSFSTRAFGSQSYTAAQYNNKLHFVFLDYKNKEERQELKEEGKKPGYYADIAVVDHRGIVTVRKTLFTSKDYDLWFLPELSDYSKNFFLLGTMSPNKFSFGVLDMK